MKSKSRDVKDFVKKIDDDRLLLISIKPKYAKLILSGEKIFELRKRAPRRKTYHAIIYETSPTKKIVGVFTIKHCHIKSVKEIIKNSKLACVSKSDINKYYQGSNEGTMIEIENAYEFPKKTSLRSLREEFDFVPPQSYCYMSPSYFSIK